MGHQALHLEDRKESERKDYPSAKACCPDLMALLMEVVVQAGM
jgi:hypothetical protein